MRKLLFLLSIFAIVLSCSSDETSTPVTPQPAPIVKYTITLSAGEGGTVSTTGGEYEAGQTVSVTATPQGEYLFKDWSDGNTNATRTITVSSNSTLTANFEKKKYPLTVNIEGEGEVLEEIVNTGRTTDYDSGTTVKLTALPAEGWEFAGWTGAVESNELSIDLTISEVKSIIANFIVIQNSFNENGLKISTNKVRYTPDEWNKLGLAYYKVQSNFYFTQNNNEYFMFASDGPDSPSIVLKRDNSIWNPILVDYETIIWGNRNYEIIDDSTFLYGGTGERPMFRPNHLDWKDHIWIGKFDGNTLTHTKVSTTQSYFHCIAVGDLTNDGLFDVIGNGGWVYIQNSDGTFKEQNYEKQFFTNDNLINYERLQEIEPSFQPKIFDLYEGGRPEIIWGHINVDYENVPEEIVVPRGEVLIYEYDESTSKYEVVYELPRRVIGRSGSANNIEITDVNADGINDIILDIATVNYPYAVIEIWLGKEDKTFYKSDEIFLEYGYINTTQFSLLDANGDGLDDVILRPWQGGEGFIENWCTDECFSLQQQGIEVKTGMKLENLIYINNGDGTFDKPNFEIRVNGTLTEWLKPFIRNGNLCFFGTMEHYGQGEYWDIEFVDIEIDKNIF